MVSSSLVLLWFVFFLISVLSGFGSAVALVEKRFSWPIRPLNIRLRRWLQRFVHKKMHRVLKCTVCTSFWMPFLCDLFLLVLSYSFFGVLYWLWPLTGFVCLGLTWLIMQVLNSIDPPVSRVEE